MNHFSTRNQIFDIPEAQTHEKSTFSQNRSFWTSQKDPFTLDREQKSTFRSPHQLALKYEGSRTSSPNIYIDMCSNNGNTCVIIAWRSPRFVHLDAVDVLFRAIAKQDYWPQQRVAPDQYESGAKRNTLREAP